MNVEDVTKLGKLCDSLFAVSRTITESNKDGAFGRSMDETIATLRLGGWSEIAIGAYIAASGAAVSFLDRPMDDDDWRRVFVIVGAIRAMAVQPVLDDEMPAL